MNSDTPVPGDPLAHGRFSDGITAGRAAVELLLAPDALLIRAADGRSWRWPLDQLRRVPGEGEEVGLRLTSATQPDARLTLDDAELLPRLRPLCPNFDALVDGARSDIFKLLGWVGASLAMLVGAYFGLPVLAGALAPMIPQAWQHGIGVRAESDLAAALSLSRAGGRVCAAQAGTEALAALLAPLAKGASLSPPHVTVLDVGLVNAFALPANRIVLTRGMIDFAASANELAGIVAHELGHLRHGDPLSALIARFEWNAMTTLVFGRGAIGSFGETVVLLSYSRSVEARADEEGLAILRAAHVDSAGFAAVMRRLGRSDSGGFSYLQSHPATADRVATIERLGQTGGSVIDEPHWTEVRRICDSRLPFSVF